MWITRVHALGLVAFHSQVYEGVQLYLGQAMHSSSHLDLLRAPLIYGQPQPLPNPPQLAHLQRIKGASRKCLPVTSMLSSGVEWRQVECITLGMHGNC